MVKILLVDDDEAFAEGIGEALSRQHYVVDLATDGQTGWVFAETCTYDLMLLDWRVPDLDGLTFCRRRRDRGDRTPILLMTAHDASPQRVKGLDAGADDYLVKPFDIEELLARIRALLRRGKDALLPRVEWGLLRLDPQACRITYDGCELKLTAKEYELLEVFLRSPERIFSQSALLDRLWTFDDPPSENAVRRQITNLRQKLKKVGGVDVIETVYGLGYRLREPEPTPPNPLAAVWERNKAKYLDRIAIVESAIAALQSNALGSEQLKSALAETHTLAGSLGSFGFDRASQISRQLEGGLKAETPNPLQLRDGLRELRQALDLPIDRSNSNLNSNSIAKATASESPKTHLFVVDADVAFAESIATVARERGMTVELAHSFADAEAKVSKQTPDLALVDFNLPDSDGGGFEVLAQLTHRCPPVPVVVLTGRESLIDRVKVARLGGCGFLAKPVSPQQAIETVSQLAKPASTPSSKILVVDDDSELLDAIQTLLEPWGFHLVLLDDSCQFWEVLNRTQPDLLLLDVVMPDVSGIELCQVVRNDPQWYDLPVLVLSAHRDSETVRQVFVAGADDFIQKPLVEPELIARILNRLERQTLQRRIGKLWQQYSR
ncbi:response regulator [Baaleninema sp.]|uniref:response regulator n=1 Tax=Baaleninema sp. TaxID=3101197 RepID=UPI003D03540E